MSFLYLHIREIYNTNSFTVRIKSQCNSFLRPPSYRGYHSNFRKQGWFGAKWSRQNFWFTSFTPTHNSVNVPYCSLRLTVDG